MDNSSFWSSNLQAYWLCHPDKCDPEWVFSSPPPFVCGIRDVAQSISYFLVLKKILQCISIFQPPSLWRLFFLNNSLVKSMFSLFPPFLFTFFPVVACKASSTILEVAARCSRLMHFISGLVFHVRLNSKGQNALGQFFWHFKNAKAWQRRRLMFVWSYKQKERKGLREAAAYPTPVNIDVEPWETACRQTHGAPSWSEETKHCKVKKSQEGGHIFSLQYINNHPYKSPRKFVVFCNWHCLSTFKNCNTPNI